MSDLRIVFFGTPDFAATSLKALIESGFNVVAVVTAPDRPAGRGHKLTPSAVKVLAESQNLKVLQPPNLKDPAFIDELSSFEANIQVVVAFRKLPEQVWDMPPIGTFNVHGSLLPDYRGAAPINWAIVNGEKKTGVTTFKLKHEIDTGSILLQAETEIGANENAGDLYTRLMQLGADLLVRSLKKIESGDYELTPQSNGTSKHAPKIQKDDARITWGRPAQVVHDHIRGMNPFPGSFSMVTADGSTDKWKIGGTRILETSSLQPGQVSTADGKLSVGTETEDLQILEIQTPGKRMLPYSEFLRGFRGELSSIVFEA